MGSFGSPREIRDGVVEEVRVSMRDWRRRNV